jgi:hypothetical protein
MKIKLSHIRYIAPILIIAIFFLPSITYAADRPWWDVLNLTGTINDTLLNSLNGILGFFKTALSTILGSAIIPLLNNVMSFQNFFTDGVNAGWTATRDFANLFFALILLFIAIATVLNTGGLDNYTAKRMLPNFIFAALFINFSKAIVGFLIDISQIIMISLYNSFGPTLTDSIASASKIAEAGSESKIDPAIISLLTIILLVILIFVLLWTAVILIVRIVTLWFVIMLSPLAFVSGLIPPLSSISRSWQNMLQQALITGPTLMFLLYLAVTVMNASIGGNTSGGGNLIENGNLLNYALVIGLLIIANIEAQKAGQSAPTILKNAVGVAGTVATFGLGAYVGAGGSGTGKMFGKGGELVQGGVKNTDKLAGGATRGVQVLTGGKIKANSRYEAMKKDMTAANDAGKGLFGGVGQQFSQAGQKEQQEDFELKKARDLAKSKAIDEPQFKRYQGILAASQSKKATEIKEIENTEILGQQLKEATEKGYKEEAAALASRISTIKDGWSQVFGEKGAFSEYSSIDYKNEGEQLKAFFDKEFGPSDDENGNTVTKDLKSRIIRNLEDKGAGNFASGLTGKNGYEAAGKIGVLGAGAMIAKNKALLNKRKIDPDTGKVVFKPDGSADSELDIAKVYPIIANETSLDILRDPKSWTQYSRIETIKLLKALLENPKKYIDEKVISSFDKEKVEAALIGLGDTPSKRSAGFRTS